MYLYIYKCICLCGKKVVSYEDDISLKDVILCRCNFLSLSFLIIYAIILQTLLLKFYSFSIWKNHMFFEIGQYFESIESIFEWSKNYFAKLKVNRKISCKLSKIGLYGVKIQSTYFNINVLFLVGYISNHQNLDIP